MTRSPRERSGEAVGDAGHESLWVSALFACLLPSKRVTARVCSWLLDRE